MKSLLLKKVLYISYDGMTDPLGQSQVIPYLEGLTTYGYIIHLISFEKKNNFDEIGDQIKKKLSESGIEWFPLNYTKSPPVLSTVYDLLRLRRKAFELWKVHQYKIVHCRSYISSLIGIALKKKFGVHFLFDMRGFWADERVDGRIWNLKNPLYHKAYKFFKEKEREFLSRADYTVSLTENAKGEILSWHNLGGIPIKVIPCCVDLGLFSKSRINELSQSDLKKELRIEEGDFILTYLGAIGTWYMLDEMLQFFQQLILKNKRAKFLFITPEDSGIIQSRALIYNIPLEKIIIRKAQRKEVPLFLSITNFAIFFIRPMYSKRASSPTKQGEIMSMGIPLICNTGVGDSDFVVKKYNSGLLIEEFTNESYNKVIDQMNYFDYKTESIVKGAKEFYSLETGILRYSDIYNQLN